VKRKLIYTCYGRAVKVQTNRVRQRITEYFMSALIYNMRPIHCNDGFYDIRWRFGKNVWIIATAVHLYATADCWGCSSVPIIIYYYVDGLSVRAFCALIVPSKMGGRVFHSLNNLLCNDRPTQPDLYNYN